MKRPTCVLLASLWMTHGAAAPPDAVPAQARPAPSAPAPEIGAEAAAVAEEILGEVAGPPLDSTLQALVGTLMLPVQGVAAADLRDNFNSMRGARRHDALDILAPRGTPVLAATSGRVLQLMDNGDGGLMLFATDATERFIFLYAHLDDYADGLETGMPLARGQLLGYVGTSGNAPRKTPHLHFAIKRAVGGLRWSRGTPINPHPLLMPPPALDASGGKTPQQARQ